MLIAYIAITLLTAAAVSYAAYLDFVRHESVIAIADRLGTPRSWMLPLGIALAAGALGLLAGFVIPLIGTAAAAGLVLYFSAAIGAHLRARDYQLLSASVFLTLAVAALAVGLAHRGAW